MQTDRELYWILSGGSPVGPFDAAEIQTKLAASGFSSDVKACRVGSDEWLPITKLFAVATGEDTRSTVDSPSEPTKKPAVRSTTQLDKFFQAVESIVSSISARKEGRIGITILAAVALLGLIAWWLTPLTPRQVVQRFVVTDGAEAAAPYTTLNLQTALRVFDQYEDASDPSDRYELTQDRPAPPDVGGHYVGCRYYFRDSETNQRVQGEGVFHLIDADGWKIDDLILTGFNGEALPEPVSMARDYRKLLGGLTRKVKPATPPEKKRPGEVLVDKLLGPQISAWFDTGVGRFTTFFVMALFIGYEIYKRRKAAETA